MPITRPVCYLQKQFRTAQLAQGSELTALVSSPGKLHITLQVFYDAEQSSTPVMEKVLVLESKVMRTGDTVELKKESESIYNKFPPIGAGHKSAVISCIYSGDIEVGLFRTSYDVTWAYAGLPNEFSNVEINRGSAIALQVHIDDPVTESKNIVPLLAHQPLNKLASNSSTGFSIDVINADKADEIDISFIDPQVIPASESSILIPDTFQSGSVIAGRATFKNIAYKQGYSSASPAGPKVFLNKQRREISYDHLPMGKYLLALSISDVRDKKQLNSHNAIFIFESVQQ